MRETYGEIFSDMVDRQAKYEDRADIFRQLDISRNHFHNVTNPDRTTNSGNPYPFPTQWGVKATNQFRDKNGNRDLAWARAVARDCRGFFISEEEAEELSGAEPEKVLKGFMKIIERVKKEQ